MYDCALFDIDGVLVDVRKSYNSAIKKTVEFMLDMNFGKPYKGLVTDQIILKFRQSGGFNNDTDTSYAVTLAMLCNPPKNLAAGRKFLLGLAAKADETGIVSVEKLLAGPGVEKWKKILSYPAPVSESMLARVFDEFFYGPELFRQQNKLEPRFWKGRPLINNDVLAANPKVMRELNRIFEGRLAMVSGRSRLAAEYSMSSVMKFFDTDACVFLEDEAREHAKPNPYAIKKAMAAMGAKSALYAGDSAEDLLMARRAEKESGVRIAFVGIYGYSAQPSKTLQTLKKLGVQATARSVNQLPAILKRIK
jgi:phosphoglycolate phosphatase-like HAD superfamily hydrolase